MLGICQRGAAASIYVRRNQITGFSAIGFVNEPFRDDARINNNVRQRPRSSHISALEFAQRERSRIAVGAGFKPLQGSYGICWARPSNTNNFGRVKFLAGLTKPVQLTMRLMRGGLRFRGERAQWAILNCCPVGFFQLPVSRLTR